MAKNEIAALMEHEGDQTPCPFHFRAGEARGLGHFVTFDSLEAAVTFVDKKWQRFSALGGILFATPVGVIRPACSESADFCVAVIGPGVDVEAVADIAAVGSHNEGPPVDFDQFLEDSRSMLSSESFAAMMKNIDRVRAEHMRQSGRRVPRVKAALKVIHHICGFRVRYADPAGFRAVLLRRPTEIQSDEIERIIMSVNPEAADLVDPERLATSIHRTGEFALWWD